MTIPLLDAVEWHLSVGVEKTFLAADGRSKAIFTTIHFAFTVANVAVCLAQSLLLEENGKILTTKVQPGGK
jgi:hypothetical protein